MNPIQPQNNSFDKAYFDRFYRNPNTRVGSDGSIEPLVEFVASYVKYLAGYPHRILDIGCGLGFWQAPLLCQFPNADYVGVDVSEYLCQEYGWELGSVVDYSADQPFDLVICQGVLQYLNEAEAEQAIANLDQLCSQFLYLEVLTKKDWEQNCDQTVTDGNTYKRNGSWYHHQLGKYFTNLGGGLFLSQRSKVVLYEMEIPG